MENNAIKYLDYSGLEYYVNKVRDNLYDSPTEVVQEAIDSGITDVILIYSYGEDYAFGYQEVTDNIFASLFTDNTDLYAVSSLRIKSNADNTTIQDLQETFYGCTNLTYVNLSNLTIIPWNGVFDAFVGCTSLTTLYINLPNCSDGINIDVNLGDCPLDSDSVNYIICHLPIITDDGAKTTLTLSESSYSYVTTTLESIATNRGWDITY